MADQLATLAGRLTDRDRAVLRLVGDHRVFTTAQLAHVFFHSKDRAEHRLRELTQARVLARFRPQTRHGEGSAPFHDVLGPLGAAVLAAEQGVEARAVGYRADKALAIAHSQRLAAKLLAHQELADATRIPTPVLFWLPSSGREASVRQALATTGRWGHDHAHVRFVVANARPDLAAPPPDRLGRRRPRCMDARDCWATAS
jgi:Replication-relaxation